MTDFQSLSGLGQIASDYDVVLCDIWGVVHNGQAPYKAATEALELFRSGHGPVILLSNSPQPSVAIPNSFAQIGIRGEFYDAIVTSGDATIDELSRRAPGPAFKLGPERDDTLYENLELHFADIGDANFIACTGMFDDDDHPDDYVDMLTEARDAGLPFICANPDVKVRLGDRVVYCGGALAQIYERMGGEVIFAGKPHEPIYRLARAWINEMLGYSVPADRVLCIGDKIFTDLVGAQQQDYDCLFIQDGLYGETMEKFKALLTEHGIKSRYMAPNLSW